MTILIINILLRIGIKSKKDQQVLLESIGKIMRNDENIYYKWRQDTAKSIIEESSLFVGKQCLDVKCSECKEILWENDIYDAQSIGIPVDDDRSNSYLTSLLHNIYTSIAS